MIIRFFLLWALLSAFTATWIYFLNKKEKGVAKRIFKGAVISAIISGVLLFVVMLINNIGGV